MLIRKWKKISPIRTNSELYVYWFLAKSPTYTFIPTYTYIDFFTFTVKSIEKDCFFQSEFVMGARENHLLGIIIKILLDIMNIVSPIGVLWQKVFKNSHLYVYSGLYYSFPKKISHLYFYLEPSSIQNFRVGGIMLPNREQAGKICDKSRVIM